MLALSRRQVSCVATAQSMEKRYWLCLAFGSLGGRVGCFRMLDGGFAGEALLFGWKLKKQRFPWDFRVALHLRDSVWSWWCSARLTLSGDGIALPRRPAHGPNPRSILLYSSRRPLFSCSGKANQPSWKQTQIRIHKQETTTCIGMQHISRTIVYWYSMAGPT